MKSGRAWTVVLCLAAVAAGGGWLVQREHTATLQSEIALLRAENRRLGLLRSENEKLCATQTPEAELKRLRADRAALLRLRAEIDQLQAKTEEKARHHERAAAAPKSEKAAPE